jgi:ubiquinone/menaquinone biosynthesis C-methylase UbiE
MHIVDKAPTYDNNIRCCTLDFELSGSFMLAKIINTLDPNYTAITDTYDHFSRIAPKYRDLRINDPEPVSFIARELVNLPSIKAVDVGCGAGRYDLLLCRYLGDKLHLTCADTNPNMLEALDEYLVEHSISNFTSMHSKAENLPFPKNTMDCVYTFNAIHHFNLREFLHESARILKSGGYLFIYTRLREQNMVNIWGRYFPKFHQKETRLYTLHTLAQSVATVPNLQIKSIKYFKYRRKSSLAQLVERARAHHYSTFSFYSLEELEEAIALFTQKIMNDFKDAYRIHWYDEYALFIIRKES